MRGRFNGRVVGQEYTGRNTRHNGRAGMYNAVQSAFAPSLDITLANGLGPLFTYTRATTATVKDFESLIKGCLSGELRVQGARREQNWVSATDDASGWTTANGGTGTASKTANYATAPDGTTTATRLVATKGSGFGALRIGLSGTPSGTQSIQTIWIKSNTGSSQTLSLSNLNAAYAYVTATTSWQRLSSGVTTCSPTISSMELGAGGAGADASIDILVWHPSVNDVTGLSNQNPPEFISRGVLSSPYHGYFVDGVKYFSYQNGNTVSSNVVTEASGAAITGTIGYLAEGAITQLFTQTEDLSHADWSKTSLTISANTAVSPDGATTMDTCTPSAASAFLSQTKTISSGAVHIISGYFKKKDADDYCCLTGSDTVANGVRAWFNLNTGTVGSVTGFGAGWSGSNAAIEEYGTGTGIYRCSFVITPTGTTLAAGAHPSVSGDNTVVSTVGRANYAWGLNINAGSVLSSYVPATTAAVARNADVLSAPSAGIVDIANGTTVFVKVASVPSTLGSAAAVLFCVASGVGDYVTIYINASGFVVVETFVSSGATAVVTGTTDVRGTTNLKVAAVFKTNDVRLYVNGVAEGTPDTNCAMPTVTTINIGSFVNGSLQPYMPIAQEKVYRTAFSAARAIAETAP